MLIKLCMFVVDDWAVLASVFDNVPRMYHLLLFDYLDSWRPPTSNPPPKKLSPKKNFAQLPSKSSETFNIFASSRHG